MSRYLSLILAFLVSMPVAARMYEWVSPATGTVHLTGIPPSWYRSGDDDAPRVRVYDDGRLIDDTAIVLSPEDRQEIRDAAFRDLERRQQIEAVRRLERAARREAARQAEAREKVASAEQEESAQPESETPEGVPGALDAAMVERLKAIISEYDRIAAESDQSQPGVPGADY